MNQINDGGSAFPCQPMDAQANPIGPLECGMSLRDWFAGQALSGILANSFLMKTYGGPVEKRAKDAYEFADAMIKQKSTNTETK